jgi:hypothetical protein
MQVEVTEWRERFIAEMATIDAEEGAFWRNELADPWAAEFWRDQQQRWDGERGAAAA